MSTAAIVGGTIAAAGISGGSALAASGAQAGAAQTAAQLQAQEAQNALQFQQQEWNTTQANEAPFLKAGQGAVNTLSNQLNSGVYGPWTQQFQAPTAAQAAAISRLSVRIAARRATTSEFSGISRWFAFGRDRDGHQQLRPELRAVGL